MSLFSQYLEAVKPVTDAMRTAARKLRETNPDYLADWEKTKSPKVNIHKEFRKIYPGKPLSPKGFEAKKASTADTEQAIIDYVDKNLANDFDEENPKSFDDELNALVKDALIAFNRFSDKEMEKRILKHFKK